MVWLEVETKVKLKDSEVDALRKKIKEIANFEKEGKKSDDYFAIKKKGYPKKAFRFRTMKDSTEVNFKKSLKQYWTKEIVVKQEFEFVLKNRKNRNTLIKLFEDFGFREWVRKIKMNETYKHKKNKKISIEINRVKYLGYFMEIEYLCERKDVKKAISAIKNTLDELEIKSSQVDNTGYTKMLWKRGNLSRNKFID